jgi:hypothetical protein
MWALVQKNRGGRRRSIGREDAGGGFGQVRQPLTHPRETRCGKARQRWKASRRRGEPCNAVQAWNAGSCEDGLDGFEAASGRRECSNKPERTRADQSGANGSGAIGTSAVGPGNRAEDRSPLPPVGRRSSSPQALSLPCQGGCSTRHYWRCAAMRARQPWMLQEGHAL